MAPPKERFDKDLFSDANEATEMDEIWNQGQEARNQPIGSFQVDIASATLERAQSSDRLQISYELVILAGAFKDEVIHKYDGLATPEQASITQSQLSALGVPIEKITISQLPAILLKLVHQKAAIKTKQNGPYYNIYFQKLIAGAPKSVPDREGGSRKKATSKKKKTAKQGRSGRPF